MPATSSERPIVIVSSVVRSSHQGQSHGGVYLVDLANGSVEQRIDWNESRIDWEGRGGDRGLRGIAFHRGRVLLAASDEIFVFDRDLRPLGSFRNRYLKHCHEIAVSGDRLFLASTGYDSVLEYDLRAERFVRGACVRYGSIWKARRRLKIRPRPAFRVFDPEAAGGPPAGDTSHVNNVAVRGDVVLCSGVNMGTLWRIDGDRATRYADIPYGSHNAQPFRDGVLLNHTATDRVAFVDRRGRVRRSYPIRRYDPSQLEHGDLPSDKARQAFGRGLAVLPGDASFVAGSSPASVTLYRFDPAEVLTTVTISKDLRNAVHGLEIWPY
jgi:hypothetical protein